MRNLLLASLIMVFFISCKSQNKSAPLHPIIAIAKETSLYSDQVEWPVINAKFIELSNGDDSPESLKVALQYLINSIGDKHATVRNANDYSILVNYKGEHPQVDHRDGAFMDSVINDLSARFSYALLDDNIGYLKIVGIGGGDVQAQSEFIRNGLVDLKTQEVDKWIIDLRYNGGGNIEPMMCGIAPLIGEGFVGGAISRTGRIRDYKIENGNVYNYERQSCEMTTTPSNIQKEKVAVLLSRYTASSGEMLAISFKGRDNTIFIGEETAGYTTGNGMDQITDDLYLLISQDIFIDRLKNKYEQHVDVDISIPFQHDVIFKNDEHINQAKRWLMGL